MVKITPDSGGREHAEANTAASNAYLLALRRKRGVAKLVAAGKRPKPRKLTTKLV